MTSSQPTLPSSPLEVLSEWLSGSERSATFQAVPGAGKTTVLEQLSPRFPQGSVTVAFSREIVREVSGRVTGRCSTVHALGLSLLKAKRPGGAVGDPDKLERLARELLGSASSGERAEQESAKVALLMQALDLNLLSLGKVDFAARLERRGLREDAAFVKEHLPALKARSYEDFKATGRVSFTEMVYLACVLNTEQHFPLVAVDEAQDLSPAAMRLLTGLGERLLFCGDRYQSIFGFAGAGVGSMQALEARAGVGVETQVTHRCPQSVVALARSIHPGIQAAPDAPEGEVRYLEESEALSSLEPGELVLARHNAPLIRVCLSLRAKGRSCFIRGVNLKNRVLSSARSVEGLWRGGVGAIDRFEAGQLGSSELGGTLPEGLTLLRALLDGGVRCEAELVKTLEDFERPQAGAVQLATLHRSKGLESGRVTLIDIAEGGESTASSESAYSLPEQTPEEREQDRNAKYVGLTRTKARDGGRLTLCASKGAVGSWLSS